MNIQELIDARTSITPEQELSLRAIIGYRRTHDIKLKIKNVLQNRFYTLFDGSKYAKQFNVKQESVVFTGNKTQLSELVTLIKSL